MFVFPRIDYRMMCADLSQAHLDRWDTNNWGIVGEWFDIHGIRKELFQMSWRDGGFSFPSSSDRQNTLAIRTILAMMTSPDEITRKLMKQFEFEQAQNCRIEYGERDPEATTGFFNLVPSHDQIEVNPDVMTQSIFPQAFKAHQEG
jgi:hypothetical protein